MKIKLKHIITRERHKRRMRLIKRIWENPGLKSRNKYRQDELLMACVRNSNLAFRVYG